jgi:hypothetical protein
MQRLSLHSGVGSWGRAQAKQLIQSEAVSFQKKQCIFLEWHRVLTETLGFYEVAFTSSILFRNSTCLYSTK